MPLVVFAELLIHMLIVFFPPVCSGRGGGGEATLLSASLAFNPETPVDVLKARVDVTKNLFGYN